MVRNGTAIATTPVPSFTDSGLSPATAYTYKVSAYDAAGNESARSTGLKVTTAAPAGTNVLGAATTWSFTDTRVDLGTTWKDPGYAVAAPLWRSGVPQFGFGDGDEATVVGQRRHDELDGRHHVVLPHHLRRRQPGRCQRARRRPRP